MPPNEPIRVPKTAELVAQQIRRRIVHGELREGDALPPEGKLLQEFAVSRPTLREAFRVLESESLITIRRGAKGGARVRAPDIAVAARYAALLLQVRGITVSDVYNARLALEPAAARSLAEQANNSAALARLRAALDDEAAVADDRQAHAAASTRFHELLVELSGNETLAVLAGMLHEIIEAHIDQAVAASPDRPGTHSQRNRSAGIKAHGKLLDLLADHDGPGAERFWRRHMEAAGQLVLRDLGPKSVIDLMG